ncbi:MAG: hypothetical protein KZQ56_08770 [gamma proteobacterium symbiont of Lucinoma myriamae]|nr:hypothetical protein [gamma proteobacterium symbiont of Lucinoma myriamae]
MKTKKLALARTALRWGLGLLIIGTAVFLTVFALQLSPVQTPVAFWQNIFDAAFLLAMFGAALIMLVGLTFIPIAFRHSQKHLQAHGQSYSTVFFAIIAGLSGLFVALTELVKTHGPAVAEMMDSGDEDETAGAFDSPWSESVGNTYDIGSYEWWRSR